MTQGVLPFNYVAEKETTNITCYGGLPAYLDLAHALGLQKSIIRHLTIRRDSQGWQDYQIVTALILLNLAGGDSVDDLKKLEADTGFCKILRKVIIHGLKPTEKRKFRKFLQKNNNRVIPSPSSVFRYLSSFHDTDQEKNRESGKAFIPMPNGHLQGFSKILKDLLSFVQTNCLHKTATLDMDATLIATHKTNALYSYKSHKSYQPINTWWAEQGMIIHTEFRDGNVPAGYEQLRVLKESLSCLPEGVKAVRLRSDTAGYQHDLLKYCDQGNHTRFGRIEFAIGCDVTSVFKLAVSKVSKSDWKPLYKMHHGIKVKTSTEWAEVCFVPNAIGHSKNGPEYRYLVKRTLLHKQESLPGLACEQSLPFPTMDMKTGYYKIFGIVTNMAMGGGKLINWHHERCGKSEEAHSVMKEDLAGGKFPSNDFGENAAWWWVMMLSLNLNAVMKKLVLGGSWVNKRMKAIRFSLINLPARIVERSRKLFVKVKGSHPSFDLLIEIRRTILQLKLSPG